MDYTDLSSEHINGHIDRIIDVAESIEPGKVTVLTGSNSSGKSVVRKQRLNCLMDFFENKFPDSNGNYWKDFSKPAQRFFKGRNCLTFYFLRENCSDEKVRRAFLNVNFTGVPMSKEHIEFVKSINI